MDIKYQRLPFEEYFINTSEDFTHTGRVTYPVKYIAVKYNTTKIGKLFGIAHEVNYEIHYEPARNVIQMHFQRSQGAIDWIANVFEFGSRYYDAIEFEGEPLQIRVHHGWGNMYLAVKRQVREEWANLHEAHPDAATEILGWSLGSAVACLCCQDLNYNFGVRPYLYTFGSVRPFKYTPLNRERMQRYFATLYTECANFADVNDLISYLPPFRGFTMIRRVNVGTELKRSIFRLIHPLRYHVHYDLPELYRKYMTANIILEPLDIRFSVCKVTDYSGIDITQPFCFTGTTDEENSLVCPEALVPENTVERNDGWRGFRITGQLDFSLIGILARISKILASNGIGIFAVSTYNTDYILTKEENFEKALKVLKESEYGIEPKQE